MNRRAGHLGRWLGCTAVFALFSVVEITGCGSKSDLLIGRNAATAPTAGDGGAGGADAGTDANGARPDAMADAAPDAPLDSSNEAAACATADIAPPGSLLHRYSFEGTGTVARDSVSGADGEIKPGAKLDGNGTLTLDGNSGYVNLPNHLISVLSDVTFVTWATFLGGAGYERIFDFGVGVGEDDTSGQGQSYVAVAPYGGTSRLLMLARKSSADMEIQITSSADISDKLEHQVALVFASASHAELYLDGQLLGRVPIPFSLSDIDDLNDWIGRSQWTSDHFFNGTIDEFRIYGQALSPCAIRALDDAGPNAP